MTTPIGRDIGESLEAMRDTVVDLLLVGVRFVVGLADTLGDDLWITLSVTGIFTVGTLHAGSIFQEIATKRTTHDVVELLCDKLVTLLLVNLLLLLSDGTLTVETNIERAAILQLLGYKICQCADVVKNVVYRYSPKLSVRWIRPTGSNANQLSIRTGPAEAPPGAPPAYP